MRRAPTPILAARVRLDERKDYAVMCRFRFGNICGTPPAVRVMRDLENFIELSAALAGVRS